MTAQQKLERLRKRYGKRFGALIETRSKFKGRGRRYELEVKLDSACLTPHMEKKFTLELNILNKAIEADEKLGRWLRRFTRRLDKIESKLKEQIEAERLKIEEQIELKEQTEAKLNGGLLIIFTIVIGTIAIIRSNL